MKLLKLPILYLQGRSSKYKLISNYQKKLKTEGKEWKTEIFAKFGRKF